jgi:hypothetical protein
MLVLFPVDNHKYRTCEPASFRMIVLVSLWGASCLYEHHRGAEHRGTKDSGTEIKQFSVLLSREAMLFCARFCGARQFGCGYAALGC